MDARQVFCSCVSERTVEVEYTYTGVLLPADIFSQVSYTANVRQKTVGFHAHHTDKTLVVKKWRLS